jgi:hypothetical protein
LKTFFFFWEKKVVFLFGVLPSKVNTYVYVLASSFSPRLLLPFDISFLDYWISIYEFNNLIQHGLALDAMQA